jgi:Bifunctional DNA primase/polymerase, N-terminal
MTGEQLGLPPAALDPAELHQAARAYCLLGWSVIPATATGKRALVTWTRWQSQAPDLELVDRWWRRWPAANIAVITGRLSGVVVVDLDVRHGAERSLAELEAQAGDLPWRAVVETPSGGWHVYLQHPRFGVPNSASKLGAGVDVRGDRGLALLPPSRRGLGSYRWAVGGPDTVPPMPNGWRRLLRPRTARKRAEHVWREPGEGEDAARMAGLLRAVRHSGAHAHNNTLYWAACRLGELLARGAPEDWAEWLVDAGVDAGQPAGEARGTVASGLARMGQERAAQRVLDR